MSPESQQMAIAEACGIVSHDRWGPLYKTDKGIVRACPDYLNDLNAMHEAEQVLGTDEWQNYRQELWLICADNDIRATAAQRAESFLRAIRKWEDGK